jgi:hypothetical protein
MTERFKKLAQVQIPDSATTLYTVPTGMDTIVKHIRIVNPTGVAATVKLWHDGTADVNVILPTVSIDAGGWAEFDGAIEMEPGDTMSGIGGTNLALTITIYGMEIN